MKAMSKFKPLAVAILLLLPIFLTAQRKAENFDRNWLFSLEGASARSVDLPHDWSIEGEFDTDNPTGCDGGWLPTGKGLYSKKFRIPAEDKGKQIRLYFEGVYMNSTVSVNGDSIGGHPYGYSSFWVDITPAVKFGEENTVEVSVDNSQQKNCRWYSGSGIYRHVWLVTTPKTHIDEWGVAICPKQQGDTNIWDLDISVGCENLDNSKIEFCNTVYDPAGKVVASLKGGSSNQNIKIDTPALWSPESPALYTVKSQILADGKVLDEVVNTTGFRTITYDAQSGMTLNGKPIVLNGGCVHHDNGILGAKSYDAAEARKVKLLKDAGFNAVRTSHNIPSPAFLDECDRQGLLVIDEAFDGWRDAKNKHDYSVCFDEWWPRDIESMVLRDRNHPSVFCWSIGNEVIERKKLEVVTTAKKLADYVRHLDPTRPVTSALTTWDKEWEIFDPLAAVHDIVGYNYQLHRAGSDHARVPERVILQTESYPKDAYKNWRSVNDNPYVLGDFVWTALDYVGESSIGRAYYKDQEKDGFHTTPLFPWHGAYCGDIDVTGYRKPISHYRDMLYNTDRKLYMAVREPDNYRGKIVVTDWGVWPTRESWNWPGHEGKPIEVEVVSRYPRVRLTVDGDVVAEQAPDSTLRAVFTVPYMPGRVEAAGLAATGEVMETVSLATAGKPYTFRLVPSATTIKADGQDLSFIEVEIVDKDGNVVPDADNEIVFSTTGPVILEATGSADMKDTVSYSSPERKAWQGRAMAVVKSTDKRGKGRVKVEARGLRPATAAIVVK